MNYFKKKKFYNGLIAIVLLLTVFYSSTLTAFAYNYNGDEYTNVPGTGVYYDANVSTTERDITVNYYANLPYPIKQYLAENGINIYMISVNDNRTFDGMAYGPTIYYYSNYQIASTDYSTCHIEYYANGRTNDDGTLPHEVGHIIDYYSMIKSGVWNDDYVGISNTSRWIYYYTTYYQKLLNIDGSTRTNVCRGADEGFAEAVRILYTNPDKIIAISPDMYNYLVQNISNIIGGDCTPPSIQAATQTIDTFDYVGYANAYPDLYAVFGYDRQRLYEHYINCGKAEGRIANFSGTATPTTTPAANVPQTFEHFDYTAYANTYLDLYAVFGYNAAALYNHYTTYGKAEGRIATFH